MLRTVNRFVCRLHASLNASESLVLGRRSALTTSRATDQ